MSDNWITIISEDPTFVPNESRRVRALAWLKDIAPSADEFEATLCDTVEFFDCGANFERILCPSCRAEIPVAWWQERMDDDFDRGFKLLKYPVSCCGVAHTLHELNYEWPQGFGRFALGIMNPGIGKLNEAQQLEVEEILGTRCRIIYQHI